MHKSVTTAALAALLAAGAALAESTTWILELQVAEGDGEAFATLMDDMAASARATEPGTVIYEWYRGAEPGSWKVLERYADDDALLAHLGTFKQKFAERFLALVVPQSLTVYGAPGEAARGVLAGFGAVYFEPEGGLNR